MSDQLFELCLFRLYLADKVSKQRTSSGFRGTGHQRFIRELKRITNQILALGGVS